MASAILHIKDSYYFDVPKFMWQYHYTSLDQVPEFLREAHPHSTPGDFNQELAGKILIPQPFGTLQNLYERKSGFAISKFMVLEVVIALVLGLLFIGLARRMRTAIVPRGKLWHFLEGILFYIRDEIAHPAIGHDADRFVPLLWTLFFFILCMNLMGLVPWAGSPTAAMGVTATLAVITFATVFIAGIAKFGVLGFFINQVPHMDLPWYALAILWPVVFAIELLGLCIKHAVLAVRLLANMVAGHMVLLSVMAMAFSLEGAKSNNWWIAAAISIIGSTLLSCLELLVALLQAYVFTFLSALFIGAAVHRH